MSMEQINYLYLSLKAAKEVLEARQAELKTAEDNYSRLSRDLGETLYSLGLTEVKMQDGREVGVKTTFYGSVAQDRVPAVREYLQAKGNEGILKPKKLNLSENDIDGLPDELKEKVTYEINANTLKAFLAEQHRKGELTQETYELFAIHTENKVVLA